MNRLFDYAIALAMILLAIVTAIKMEMGEYDQSMLNTILLGVIGARVFLPKKPKDEQK